MFYSSLWYFDSVWLMPIYRSWPFDVHVPLKVWTISPVYVFLIWSVSYLSICDILNSFNKFCLTLLLKNYYGWKLYSFKLIFDYMTYSFSRNVHIFRLLPLLSVFNLPQCCMLYFLELWVLMFLKYFWLLFFILRFGEYTINVSTEAVRSNLSYVFNALLVLYIKERKTCHILFH